MTSTLESLKIAAEKLKNKYTLTPLECHLRDATNNENWSTDTKILQEIADATYNYNDFNVVTQYIWEKITSKSKNWRQVLKTLNMIEYLLKNGAPRCINEFKDELFQIRSLQDYQLFEQGLDRGAAVRERSKAIVELLTDETQLDQEREQAQQIREKLSGIGGMSQGTNQRPQYDGFSNNTFKNVEKESPTQEKKYGSGGSGSGVGTGSHYDDTGFQGNLDRFRKKEEKEKEREKEKEQKEEVVTQKQQQEKPQPAFQATIFKIPKPGEDGQITVVSQPGSKPQNTTTNTVGSKTQVSNANSLIDFDQAQPVPQQTSSQDPFGNWNEVQTSLPPAAAPNSNSGDFNWGWNTTPAPVQTPAPFVQPNLSIPKNPNPVSTPFNFTQPVMQPTNPVVNPNINNNQIFMGYNPGPTIPINNNSSPFNFSNPTPAPVNVNNAPFNFSTAPVVNPVVNKPTPVTNQKQNDDDGFSNFESANQSSPQKLPGLNEKEARMIDLSNLQKEDGQQQEEQNSKAFNGLQKKEGGQSNLLYTTKEDLDSFSLFGTPSKMPNQPPQPVFNQAPNYNALYTNAPAPGYGYNQPNMMMYPNNNNMGMNMNPNPGYNQFQMGGGGFNQGFPNQQYNNNNAFNFK